MEKNFHQAEHAEVVDLDAGDFAVAGGNGKSQALEQWEIDMDIESLGFEGSETVGNGRQCLRTFLNCPTIPLAPKSRKLLLRASRRRKLENFSYRRNTAFLPQARST